MLRIQELSKRFEELVALASLDVVVARGCPVALVGHNGSGKSTALSCLSGRSRRTTGTVTFDDRALFDSFDDPRARALLSYVGDSPAFYPNLTVREHLELVALAHGLGDDARSEVDQLLSQLQLAHRHRHLPMQLSAGMRQKLQLACGLIRPFEILVLDEPARYLDATAVGWLAERIEGEKARGAVVVFASHEPSLVRRLADEVVVLAEGEVRTQGDYDQVVAHLEVEQAGPWEQP